MIIDPPLGATQIDTSVMLDGGKFYTVDHKGCEYVVSTHGAARPLWLMEAFVLEDDIRQGWWNIKEGDIVIDVGAGYGSYTLSALVQGAALVVALEPNKEEFFSLCSMAGVNGWATRLVALPYLAGVDSGPVFYDSYTHARHGSEKRLGFTVDKVAQTCGLRQVDWIKVDVEGDELNVLQSAQGVLKRCRPMVLVENHTGLVPDVDEQIRAYMQPLGYDEIQVLGKGVNDNWSLWTPVER